MYKNNIRNDVNPLHSAVQCTSIEIGSTTPTPYLVLFLRGGGRAGGRHVWKNDDNVSIVLHKQERAS